MEKIRKQSTWSFGSHSLWLSKWWCPRWGWDTESKWESSLEGDGPWVPQEVWTGQGKAACYILLQSWGWPWGVSLGKQEVAEHLLAAFLVFWWCVACGWAWGIDLCFQDWSSGRHGLWLSRGVFPSRGYLPNLGAETQRRNGEGRPWKDGLWESSDTWMEAGEASCSWCSVAALGATLRIRFWNRDNGEGPSLGSLPGTLSSLGLFLSLNWVFARGGGWDTTKRKKPRWGFEIHRRCGQWQGEAVADVLLQH